MGVSIATLARVSLQALRGSNAIPNERRRCSMPRKQGQPKKNRRDQQKQTNSKTKND